MTITIFKPMLSASLDGVDLSTLKYPLIASPKLDGIRCIMRDGVAYSRNMKPIRNNHVQNCLARWDGLDGELIVGSPTDPLCMSNTSSGVMSYSGSPDFQFHVFDHTQREGGFSDRLEYVELTVGNMDEHVEIVRHTIIRDHHHLRTYEEVALQAGYEGVMLRAPQGPYKAGRSTVREGYLMKLKRFIDGEAKVTGLEEAMENQNLAVTDELGRTHRSSHMENLSPKGMVGTILVEDPTWGPLRLQPGVMKHNERVNVWNFPELLLGKTVHWRAFGYGVKDKPRFARYYGVREDAS